MSQAEEDVSVWHRLWLPEQIWDDRTQCDPRLSRQVLIRSDPRGVLHQVIADVNDRNIAVVLVVEVDPHRFVETPTPLLRRHAWKRNVILRDRLPVRLGLRNEFLVFVQGSVAVLGPKVKRTVVQVDCDLFGNTEVRSQPYLHRSLPTGL